MASSSQLLYCTPYWYASGLRTLCILDRWREKAQRILAKKPDPVSCIITREGIRFPAQLTPEQQDKIVQRLKRHKIEVDIVRTACPPHHREWKSCLVLRVAELHKDRLLTTLQVGENPCILQPDCAILDGLIYKDVSIVECEQLKEKLVEQHYFVTLEKIPTYSTWCLHVGAPVLPVTTRRRKKERRKLRKKPQIAVVTIENSWHRLILDWFYAVIDPFFLPD